MEIQDYTSLILYFGRSSFYNSMQKTALDGLTKYPSFVPFRFYNGLALVLGGNIQEGFRELKPLKSDTDLGLGATIALLYAYKNCDGVDVTEINALENQYHEKLGHFTANAMYYSSMSFFFIGQISKCVEFLDKTLKMNTEHEDAIVLKVWAELKEKNHVASRIIHALESIIQKNTNIDAVLVQVHYFRTTKQYDNAISALNRLSIRLPELNVPIIEKMKTYLAGLNWDQAFETALHIINLDPNCISAISAKALLLLLKDGNQLAWSSTFEQLLKTIEMVEMGNSVIIFKTCQTFSRICSRNTQALHLVSSYIEKITLINPKNVAYITELGFLKLMLGDTKEALNLFHSAINIDDSFYSALCGVPLCLLHEDGNMEQVRQNVEFLEKLEGMQQDPLFLFLKSKILNRSNKAISLLNESTEIHLRKLENLIFSEEYIRYLNPDFLIQVIFELLRHSPVQHNIKFGSKITTEKTHITFKLSLTILETILRVCPLHVQALYLRAKVDFLCGEATEAVKLLHQIVRDVDPTYTEAYLLLASIQLQMGQFTKAIHFLELALSHDFLVRRNPMYYLLLGISQLKQQNVTEAKKSLLTAMQLIGAEQNENYLPNRDFNERCLHHFSATDKVTLYLEYASSLRESGEMHEIFESERILQSALEEFHNTPEEGRLIIAKADVMIRKYNISGAISLLKDVQSNQSYFAEAKTHLAHILLKYQNDRAGFTHCFENLVKLFPDPENFLILGEAYMSIQEPSQAIVAFKNSLLLQPHDTLLASKLGRAYVKTHQYGKAVNYYQEALKNPLHSDLKLDLAELYMKLKLYQNGIELLTENHEHINLEAKDLVCLQFRTKQLLLLARIYEKFGENSKSLQTLKDAKNIQYIITKRIELNYFANSFEQSQVLSKICLLIADHSIRQRNYDQALTCFKESLKITPNNITILTSLARLNLQINSIDQCREICSQVLKLDSSNEAASVMMADISFRKMDFDSAAYHFSQLLLSKPCNYTALVRLIEVMRRSGTLCEMSLFLQRAEESTSKSAQSCGLNYCKGLYAWYNGSPNNALRYFNAARRDSEWGQQAIFTMIEICMNPECDIPNSNELLDIDLENFEFNESRVIALRTAERLMKELYPHSHTYKNEIVNQHLLQNFLLLSTKQKLHIETALEKFSELHQHEGYDKMVGPVLGMATSLVLLKQVQRAKNLLKRVVHIQWNFEEADFLERSWLLLANIYLSSNKLEIAQDLVDKALQHNKSCFKAYELSGNISEKGQVLKDAAKHYRKAWEFGGKTKPYIGYKLAYILMKIKNYADAIDVCHQMIRLHPDFTNIRKDILDKCRNNLRH